MTNYLDAHWSADARELDSHWSTDIISSIAVTPYFPSTAKNLALQEIISGYHHVKQNLLKLYN